MAIYNKPDENVFASSARQGEVSNFPDIGRGWGISFDQTGGIPPMEWFNFLFKRTDEKFGYLFQRGLSEWSATQTYPEGALVQYKNLTYKAKRANTNKKPDEAKSSDWQRWGFTQSELKSATLTESGITQLLTSINSNDETKSATPKSVKMAYDKGVEAEAAADAAQRTANDGVSRANNAQRTANDGVSKANAAQTSANNANDNANGRVSKSGDTMNGDLLIKRGDYSGVSLYNNSGKYIRIEGTPDSSNNVLNLVYRNAGNENISVVSIPTGSGIVAFRGWVEDRMTPWEKVSNKPAYATRWPNATEQGYSHLINQSGWARLPSGLIIQWGKTPVIHDENTTNIVFPIAFPNKVLNIQLTENQMRTIESNATHLAALNVTNTKFTFKMNSTLPIDTSADWFAIGY